MVQCSTPGVFATVNGENLRPVSDDAIEAWVDAVLQPESAATPTTGSATPPMLHGAQERVQVPAGSTPAAPNYGGVGILDAPPR